MRRLSILVLITIFMVCLSNPLNAQGTPPDPGGPPSSGTPPLGGGAPIGGGEYFLLAMGLFYGFGKYRKAFNLEERKKDHSSSADENASTDH